MKWTTVSHTDVSDEVVVLWQELNCLITDSHPTLDHYFLQSLTRFFATGDVLLAICCTGNRPVAATILKHVQPGTWDVFVPGQGCMSPLLVQPDVDCGEVLSSLIRALPGFCILLRLPQIDPDVTRVSTLASSHSTEIAVYGTTFSVNVNQAFENYWSARSKGLRYKMRKSFARIRAAGHNFEMRLITRPDSIRDGIAVHGALESSGWKGQAGTAIHIENDQGRFYLESLTRFAREQNALIAQLYFGAEPVASLLCVSKKGKLVVLKTAYQEKYRQLSPGRVLDYLFLEYCCADDGLTVAEMYTKASKSDLSWASNTRDIVDIDLYRNSIVKISAIVRRSLIGLIKEKT